MYYIVGKGIHDGRPGNDAKWLEEYFELGWEVNITALAVKYLLRIGRFNNESDGVVTLPGREFLYSRIFKTVVTYRDFLATYPRPPAVDLCDYFIANNPFDNESVKEIFYPRYRHFDLLYDFATNLDFNESLEAAEDYACVAVRYRDHAPTRNLARQYWDEFIGLLRTRVKKVFVVGLDAEVVCNGSDIVHVSLRDWATLTHRDSCRIIVGTLTGPTNLCQFTARRGCPLVVLDLDGHYGKTPPLTCDDCMNFKQLNKVVIEGYRSEAALFDVVNATLDGSMSSRILTP